MPEFLTEKEFENDFIIIENGYLVPKTLNKLKNSRKLLQI